MIEEVLRHLDLSLLAGVAGRGIMLPQIRLPFSYLICYCFHYFAQNPIGAAGVQSKCCGDPI